jgi:predicted nucleotidyltransferase component of viral defense system
MNEQYNKQVALIIRILPYIAKKDCFALKGGTAINLFYANMPRLSIDIDLSYIALEPRAKAIKNINAALERIKISLEKAGIKTHLQKNNSGYIKMTCYSEDISIKIEPNYVIRGTVFSAKKMTICSAAQELYGFAAIKVLDKAELYGGKICAALDRQHPRDLFDVKYLLDNEGLTEDIQRGFLIALISHNRPLYELILPNRLDRETQYLQEFKGMTDTNFSYKDHKETLEKLVKLLNTSLTENQKEFIMSFHKLMPRWDLLNIKDVEALPAIKWKLQNLKNLKEENLSKYTEEIEKVKEVLKYDTN